MIGAAPAKINLALVVGPRRDDGRHELATVYQRVDLGDRISVEPAEQTTVEGFPEDTIVRAALASLDAPHGWRVPHREAHTGRRRASAAAAPTRRPRCGSQTHSSLHRETARDCTRWPLGSAPTSRSSCATGRSSGPATAASLEPLDLPQDFVVLLLHPKDAAKRSTADVYAAFDERGGEQGYEERLAGLRSALGAIRRPRDLAGLPPNDLASSPLGEQLLAHGAFRADVSGAGPAVYGLFHRTADAEGAARALRRLGRTWITVPAWYG